MLSELKRVELFRELGDDELARLACAFVEVSFPAEQYLFREGMASDAFYVIREGAVVVFRDTVGKPMQLLAQLGACDFLGEFGLFDRVDHTCSARTTQPSRVLKIRKDELLAFLDGHPEIALKLQMAAARRHSLNAAAALELGARGEVRIRVNRMVTLRFSDGKVQAMTLRNLSQGGLSLGGAPAGWKTRTPVRFQLRVAGSSLDLRGRVSWRRGDTVGVAFTERSLDQDMKVQAALRQLIAPKR